MPKKPKDSKVTASPTEYLNRPYVRSVVPDSDGTFRAEILEFPGCIATGDSAAQALGNLEEVAFAWLESVLARGQRVPEPLETATGFSGKLVLRLSKALHRKAAYQAAREGVSLNSFIVTSIAQQVGERTVVQSLQTLIVGEALSTESFASGMPGRAVVSASLEASWQIANPLPVTAMTDPTAFAMVPMRRSTEKADARS